MKTNSVSSENDTDDTPPTKLPKGRMRRGAVSAEVCTEEDASHYIKKVCESNALSHPIYTL